MVENWQGPTSEQILAMGNAGVIAAKQANKLGAKSIPLGYNVGYTVGIEGGTDSAPEISFQVRRFDQNQHSADDPSFESVAEVEAYLEQLAGLPCYCLDLIGNVKIRVVSEDDTPFTVITDLRTGKDFWVRTTDLESITVLPIHAEDPPTVGDWRLC